MIKKDKNLDGKLTYEEAGAQNLSTNVIEAKGMLFSALLMDYNFANFNRVFEGSSDLFDINDDKSTDMTLKNILDKLGKGVKFDDLEHTEQGILEFHLKHKIFDEKTDDTGNKYYEFNQEKFENFYAEFKESFQQRSAEFLGLSSKDIGGLDYENLSKIVDELYNTFLDTYSTSISTIGDTINLRDRQFDISV